MTQYDEKTTTILEQLATGKTRQEIAQTFSVHWKSIDMHMRRRGFRWSRLDQTYLPSEKVLTCSKTKSILQSLSSKQPNFKKIAQKHGFQTVEEMGNYMRTEGYVWNPDIQNYIFFTQPKDRATEPQFTETTILPFLLANQNVLATLITNASLSPITVATNDITLSLTTELYEKLLRCCHNQQLTPQTVIEVALASYLDSKQ